MSNDATSESIAHFIGLMQLSSEEARLRQDYDAFTAARAAEREAEMRDGKAARIKDDHKLKDFQPKLKVEAAADGAPAAQAGALPFPGAPNVGFAVDGGPILGPATGPLGPLLSPGAGPASYSYEYSFEVDAPGAVAGYTAQVNLLSDDDLLTASHGTEFIDPALFGAALSALTQIADAAAGFDVPLFDGNPGAGFDFAMQALDAVAAVPAGGGHGVTVVSYHGAGAQGLFISEGADAADALPTLTDLLPDLHSRDGEAHFGNLNAATTDDPYAVEDGHTVITGGNIALNESFTASSWLDAPVFAVEGAVVNIDAISQVNILIGHDIGAFDADDPGSTAINAAQIVTHATGAGAEEPTDADGVVLPFAWSVTRIEGDLLQVNWTQQYNFISDNDRAEISLSGANTYIGTGDNLLLNLTDLTQIGSGFDLIFVGGNMINVAMISQTNVLLDSDVLATQGTGVDASGGDNLLLNTAALTTHGADSHTGLTEPFAEALDTLGTGADDIDAEVAQDSLFEGAELLRVLYIEGDFATANLVEQTNIVGDADQVHLVQDAMEAATGQTATVHTGANVLANVARVTEYGTDSTVMAGGGTYSDALIHQAELIEESATPTGVSMAHLTSEAVAFLADDMIVTDETDDFSPNSIHTEDSQSVDVMQSVLA